MKAPQRQVCICHVGDECYHAGKLRKKFPLPLSGILKGHSWVNNPVFSTGEYSAVVFSIHLMQHNILTYFVIFVLLVLVDPSELAKFQYQPNYQLLDLYSRALGLHDAKQIGFRLIRFRHSQDAESCQLSANAVRSRQDKAKRTIAELVATAKTGKRNSGPQNLASLPRTDVGNDISEKLITPHRSTLPTIPEETDAPPAPSDPDRSGRPVPPVPPASRRPTFDDLAAIHNAQGATRKGVAGGNCLFGALALNLSCHSTVVDHTIVRADVCHQMENEWNDPTAVRDMEQYLLALLDEKRKRAKHNGRNGRGGREDYDLALAPRDSELPEDLLVASDDRALADFLFRYYHSKMQKDGVWGGEPEIKSAARKYQRDIHVYENGRIRRYPGDGSGEGDIGEISRENMMAQSEVQPVRILRQNQNHYVAVIPASVVKENAAPSALPAKKASGDLSAGVNLSATSKRSVGAAIDTIPTNSTAATTPPLLPTSREIDDLFNAMDEKTRGRSE